jgi:hypothetical protein
MHATTCTKWLLSITVTLALVALCWGVGTALAQGPEPRAPTGGSPTESFTYQGFLSDGTAPANGAYDFLFSVWDAETSGNMQGAVNPVNDWTVTNGVFTVRLSPGLLTDMFNGGPRWLQVQVRPGASIGAYTTLPRQPITPAPYAWGLHPGAVISGTAAADSWVFKANLDPSSATASAVMATAATGNAVRASSTTGWGVYGVTEDGYAVAGYDLGTNPARGYGGYFESTNGVGAYGKSSAVASWNNVLTPGVYGNSTNGAGVVGMSSGKYGKGGHFVNTSTDVTGDQVGLWVGSMRGDIIRGYTLDTTTGVYGTLKFKVRTDGNVYADGSYNCGLGVDPCFNAGIGADVAERIDVTNVLEPGDVVEIDPNAEGHFRLSQTPYSTLAAGVVSTNPAITMNNNDLANNDTGERTDNRPLLALVGQVPVKVSGENGSIQPGDLLVTATMPGHAMKAGANPPTGSVIGKALEKFDASQVTGVVKMLATLH